jgi:HK97 family phage prohead protease
VTSIHLRRLANRVDRTTARFVELARRERLSVADLPSVKLPWYQVRAAGEGPGTEGEAATVFIFDEIGGSFGVGAKDFVAELEAIDAPLINVRINSPGGSVFDALTIANSLHHHPARVRTYVDGLAASAASVIAVAADPLDERTDTGGVIMMPGSQMMIHDASNTLDGNAEDNRKNSIFLDRQSDNIAELYQLRGGGDPQQWRDLMVAETWLFGREAVDLGLADRVEMAETAEVSDSLDGAMTRSFDLSGFRFAGRRAAPEPPRKLERARIEVTARPEPPSGARTSSDAERRSAARLRGVDGETPLSRRASPPGVSGARMAAFPAKLRAELVNYDGQQRYHLTGHASVVNTPYEMWDSAGPYMEVIDAGAFTRTLAASPDVAFLVNHRGVTMARTTNGSLRLSMDTTGLAVEAWLNPKRQDVSDLVVAIEDRDVTEMSFAFMLGDGGGLWSADFQTFRITELDLDRGDVSAVNYGANPYTDVAARSGEVLADLERLPAGAARAAVARLQRRTDITAVEALLEAPPAPAPPKAGRSLAHIEALLDI